MYVLCKDGKSKINFMQGKNERTKKKLIFTSEETNPVLHFIFITMLFKSLQCTWERRN